MRFCPDCGATIASKDVSCPACGRSLSEATVMGLPAEGPKRDVTGTTRQRLAELAQGWQLDSSAQPEPVPRSRATQAMPTALEDALPTGLGAPAARRTPPPLPPAARSATPPAATPPALAAPTPVPPPAEPSEPLRAAGDADEPAVGSPHEDPTRTVMELPPFARGRRPEGIVGALVYTARALRASVDRRLQLRRLRADGAEKENAREERLTELGETALSVTELNHAALDAARPHLGSLEDQIHAAEKEHGAIVGAMANEERQAAEAIGAAEDATREAQGRMDELDARLRPLVAEHKNQDKRLREATELLAETDRKIQALTEKRALAEIRGAEGSAEAADASARIAALRAEREAAERQIPEARSRLETLGPEIEKLRIEWEAAREKVEAHRREQTERESQKREVLQKLGERRAGVDQALGRAQSDRRIALRDLGAKLDWDRLLHPDLVPRYRALDELSGALTAIEYQIAELSREAGAVDKRAVLLASAIVLVGAVALGIVIWALLRT